MDGLACGSSGGEEGAWAGGDRSSGGEGAWGCGDGCDWRFDWPSSLDGLLVSLGRGELGDSELVTLLDAGGHGVTDRGGEFGVKRPLLGMLGQDWGGLGTIG